MNDERGTEVNCLSVPRSSFILSRLLRPARYRSRYCIFASPLLPVQLSRPLSTSEHKIFRARPTRFAEACLLVRACPWGFDLTSDEVKTTVRLESLEDLTEEPALSTASRGDAENGFHKKILARRVFDALGELTEKQRMIFLLKHREGMTCQEIAEVFDCSVGSVKKSLFRSIEKLRASFGVGERVPLPAGGKS